MKNTPNLSAKQYSSADDSLRGERECEDGIFERLVLEQSWEEEKSWL